MRRLTRPATALLGGALADVVLADPARGHPVAAFGRLAGAVERLGYADSRVRGAAHALGLIALVVVAGAAADGLLRRSPPARTLVGAAGVWTVLGGSSLGREAGALSRALQAGDLEAARARLGHLCGRDPSGLDPSDLARASVESVAENTSDAVVAPLFWGAVAGLPGLLGYRSVNTLDAMFGHRSPRYLRYGWAAARLDDVANLVPARLTGVLACLLAPLVGGSVRQSWEVLRRDGAAHPSPNAGRCEAAFAGALGLRLGGVSRYGDRVEHRPFLGAGRPAAVPDIARAVRLSRAVSGAATALAVAAAARRAPPRTPGGVR